MSTDSKGTVGTTILVNGKTVDIAVPFSGVDANDQDISTSETATAMATLSGAIQAFGLMGAEVRIKPDADVFIMEGELNGDETRTGGATSHATGQQFGRQFGIRIFGSPQTKPTPPSVTAPPAPDGSKSIGSHVMTLTQTGDRSSISDDAPVTYEMTPQSPVTEGGITYSVYTYDDEGRTRTVRRRRALDGSDVGPWLFNNYKSDTYAGTWAPMGMPPPSKIGDHELVGTEAGFDVYERAGRHRTEDRIFRTADGHWFRRGSDGTFRPVEQHRSAREVHRIIRGGTRRLTRKYSSRNTHAFNL